MGKPKAKGLFTYGLRRINPTSVGKLHAIFCTLYRYLRINPTSVGNLLQRVIIKRINPTSVGKLIGFILLDEAKPILGRQRLGSTLGVGTQKGTPRFNIMKDTMAGWADRNGK